MGRNLNEIAVAGNRYASPIVQYRKHAREWLNFSPKSFSRERKSVIFFSSPVVVCSGARVPVTPLARARAHISRKVLINFMVFWIFFMDLTSLRRWNHLLS